MTKLYKFFLVLALIGLVAGAVNAQTSGACGENLTWTLDNNGTLTISGTGAMNDYGPNSFPPWNSQKRNIRTLVIQNEVTTIGNYAFSGFESITSLTIPNSVITIGDEAFSGCHSLTLVTIPNSVTTIGYSAFYMCNSLTSLTIPNSVTTIRDLTFSDCFGLISLTIPNSVTTIGYQAFSYCTGLTDIYVNWTNPPIIQTDIFWGVYQNVKLHIPQGILSTYQVAPVWQDFILVDDVVTGIEQIAPASIRLYPNPVQDVLKIESGEMKMDKVEICDLSGRIVETNYISQPGTATINVSALPAGVYFVRMYTEKGIMTKKIIKT